MSVKSRRQAREAALAALYYKELGKVSIEEGLTQLQAFQDLDGELQAYASSIVEGVCTHQPELDALIQNHLKEYTLARVSVVDRILLRIACFELYHVPTVPPKVSLDEAIELAKKYSTAESGRFVNGVLGAILPNCPKAQWEPVEPMEEPTPPEPEPEVIEIAEESPEGLELARVGKWQLRTGEPA